MTRSRLAMWSLAAAAAVGCGAMGQSSSRGTMVTDDGQSRRVLHFSEPDLDAVRRPDFELSDVTVFVDTLLLSEAQRDALRRLIGKYLDDYAALVKARNPELDPGPGRSRISAGLRAVRGDESGDESAEAPAAGEIENHQRGDEGDVQRAPGGPGRSEPSGGGRMDPVEAIILDELKKAGFETDSLEDSPYAPSISVSVSAERAEAGEEAPAMPEPSIDVRLSFGRDDDSLSAEMRENLQQVAARAVPRIKEQIRADLGRRMMRAASGPSPEDQIGEKWAEVQALHGRIKAFLEAKKGLRRQYVITMQAMLAEEQLELWPLLERALTRVKTLPWGRLDGESADVLAMLRELDVSADETKRLAEHLASFAVQLHQALSRRNEMLADIDAEIDRALNEGRGERALALAGRLTRARLAVRDLNERYAEIIAGALDETNVEAFRERMREASYPRVYRKTLAQRAIDAALGLAELDDDVRATIEATRDSYALQLDDMNRRLARAIRAEQPKELETSIQRAVALTEGEAVDFGARDAAREEIMDGFRARRELDVRTMRSVYALLSPAQRAQLPRIPEVDVAEPVMAEDVDE